MCLLTSAPILLETLGRFKPARSPLKAPRAGLRGRSRARLGKQSKRPRAGVRRGLEGMPRERALPRTTAKGDGAMHGSDGSVGPFYYTRFSWPPSIRAAQPSLWRPVVETEVAQAHRLSLTL